MAKKKKTAKQQTFLSPEQYVREKARTLEIGDCFINESYKENGLGHIIVSRLHKGGRKTIGCYMVDTYFWESRMRFAGLEWKIMNMMTLSIRWKRSTI